MFKNLLPLISTIALGSCAIISAPTGGEKDETPPEIINTFPPNQSVHFNAESIEITFDEYVELKDFTTQFYSSPPLEKPVQPKLKGKKLTLYLDEELLPNTTYTFSFGNSLQDITEGNIQGNFKYVFSTGDYLDSLSIKGMVIDAFTGLPLEGMITVLYPTDIPDTTLLKERPLYYSVTNEQGQFSLDNLADRTFQVFAIKDENLNLRYDQGAEQYGFKSNPISSADSTFLEIRAYKDPRRHSLEGVKYSAYGKAIVGFGQPTQELSIDIIENVEMSAIASQTFIEFERDRDTAFFWFNRESYPEDLNFLYLKVAFDSIVEDSVRLSVTPVREPKLSFQVRDASSIAPQDSVIIESNLPITAIDPSLATVVVDNDTVDFSLEQTGLRFIHLNIDKKYSNKIVCHVLPGTVTTLYGPNEDTTKVSAKIAREEDLAILILRIQSEDQEQKIYQLFESSGGKIISEQVFTTGVNLTMPDLLPKEYELRIIWDKNKNGKWDVGEFATRNQPENIRYYPNAIELRANWELELDWIIPAIKE